MSPIPSRLPKQLKVWLGFALLIGSLALLYHHSLDAYIQRTANPLCFNDDARFHIPPMFRYRDQALFPNDYISSYILRAYLPNGYKALYAISAALLDPVVISKALPYGLLLILLIALGLGAGRLGGWAAAWAAMALVLAMDIFLVRMSGGLPRAFAFPLFASAAAAVIYGRMYLLATLVCLGAAFYPPMAMPPGIALALVLFFMPDRERGEASGWSFRHRLILLAAPALLSGLIVLPTMLGSRPYGTLIKTSEVSSYPEIGPGGRLGPRGLASIKYLYGRLEVFDERAQNGAAEPWLQTLQAWVNEDEPKGWSSPRQIAVASILSGITLIGFVGLAVRESAARRLLALTLAVFVSYSASRLLAPHLFFPQRQLLYPVPVLAAIMFPAAASALPGMLSRFTRQQWLSVVSTLSLCLLFLAFLGVRVTEHAGLNICIDGQTKIYEFVESLPPNALVAGWPTGVLENVPYLSRRQAFVTYESHRVFHRGYAEEMRKRMRALIAAYFASTAEPLVRLRDEFGVTHLIVDMRHYHQEAPKYFKPFDGWIEKAYIQGGNGGFEVLRQLPVAEVFSERSYVVLDLSRVKAGGNDSSFK